MRRLTISTLTLGLAVWGQSLLRTASGDGVAATRDGLIILAVAAAIFALNARPAPPPDPARIDRPVLMPWPLAAWLWIGAGFTLSAASAALFALQLRQGAASLTLPSLLWAVGVLLFAVGLAWRGRPAGYGPPKARWSRDAAGRFVRLGLGGESATHSRSVGTPWVWLGLILLAGAGLRFWQLTSAPPGCAPVECAVGLRILDWSQGRANLAAGINSVGLGLTVLGSLLFKLFEPGTATLRWLTALLGLLTLPTIFLIGQRILYRASGPGTGDRSAGSGGGLLAMLILAVSPLHLWFSRSTTPLALAAPLLALHLWALLRAGQDEDRRWIALVGLTWGLLFIEAAPFRLFALLWLILLLILWRIAAVKDASAPRPAHGGLVLVGAILTGSLPGLAIGLATGTLLAPPPPIFNFGQQLANFTGALLRPGGLAETTGLWEATFLDPLTGAAGALGLGLLLARLVRGRMEGGVAGIVLILSGGILIASTIATPPAAFMLMLMPGVWALAAAGLGEIWGQFAQTWRPLIRPSRALAAVTAVALVMGLAGGLGFLTDLGDVSDTAAEQSVVEAALGRYVADTLADNPGVRILVPADQLLQPATQLALAGAEVDTTRLIPLDPARHVPFAGEVSGDLIYIISNRNPALLTILQQVYPAGLVEVQHADPGLDPGVASSGAALFVAYRVPVSAVEGAQGLRGSYFAGRDFGTPAQVREIRYDGPLRFDWAQGAPLPPPFSVVWEGSLLITTFGPHTFRVDAGPADSGTDPAADSPIFSLELDGVLLLDTSLGVTEKRVDLAEGLYRVQMSYRSGGEGVPPANLAVTWERPNGTADTLPRQALYSVVLPDRGLLGTYFATPDWSGPVQAWRKDQVIGPDLESEEAYSVVWVGKLAAPVPGSYLLSVVADGTSTVMVDGQPVVESQNGPETGFQQGSVSLAAGWHNLEIRYAPGASRPGERQFQLSWQPPDGLFDQLSSEFLRPFSPATPTDALDLPVLPMLADAEARPQLQPQSSLGQLTGPGGQVPADLPGLALAPLWQAGGQCGPGAEQFNPPRGVAVDPLAGRVYVADGGNRQIKILDMADGSRTGALTSDLFEEPFDLALSPGGDLWILDAVAQQTFQAERTSGQPQLQTAAATFYRPRGLGLDRSGLRYIADTGGSRVVVLGPGGDVLGQFGGPDTPLGQGQPVDVLLSEGGALWVVTAEDGTLWRADREVRVATFTPAGSVDGPHLAGLPNSSFFVTEPEQRRVVYFSAQGLPLGQIQNTEILNKPVGIDARIYNGQIFVAVTDVIGCKVILFSGPADELP